MSARPATATRSSTTTDDALDVLIAGAGIGGLTLALALAKHGIHSHILERRQRFAPDGAGIQVGPNGARILKWLGLEPAVAKFAAAPHAVVARDGLLGDVLAQLPIGIAHNPKHTAPYWTMHRANLHGALVDAVRNSPFAGLSMSTEVLRAENTANGVTVTLGDHAVRTGSVFIGADGIHSRIRRAVFDDRALQSIGKGAARAVVSTGLIPKHLAQDQVNLWLAPAVHVVHYPIRQGKETAIIAIVDDEDINPDWTTPVPNEWVLSRCQSLNPQVRSVLECATDWQKWTLATAQPVRPCSKGRIALLGDAAHPILPFLAQGAVMAMEDAVILAQRLSLMPQNPEAALRAYAAARRGRTKRVANASQRTGRLYHLSGLAARVRNRTMKLVGGRRLINFYQWLYSWQP